MHVFSWMPQNGSPNVACIRKHLFYRWFRQMNIVDETSTLLCQKTRNWFADTVSPSWFQQNAIRAAQQLRERSSIRTGYNLEKPLKTKQVESCPFLMRQLGRFCA